MVGVHIQDIKISSGISNRHLITQFDICPLELLLGCIFAFLEGSYQNANPILIIPFEDNFSNLGNQIVVTCI